MTLLLADLRRTLGLAEETRVPDPLLAQGDCVLVAVSGGPDSLALLHALHALRAEIGLQSLSAAHFHHGLRGPEADADARFVTDFCAARVIPCQVERADIAALAAQTHVSVQQAARAARYRFLAQAAQQCGAGKVATGHTEDDQAETVLLNILRGTGLGGLRGIPAQRGVFVRPLLSVSRAQVEAYCAAHELFPRRDSSNSDPSHYVRNRVRHELLPLLAREYAPGVRGSLLRLSEIAGADADFLQAHAQTTLQTIIIGKSIAGGSLTLSRDKLRVLHPALLSHMLRAALAEVRGTTDGLSRHHLTQIADALLSPAQTRWGMTTPPPRCRIWVREREITIIRHSDTLPDTDSAKALSIPLESGACVEMPGTAWSVEAALSHSPELPPPTRYQAIFDASQVHLPSLHMRRWQPGDRIAPRGMAGHTQKLQDIFINAKVPQAERSDVPVVEDRAGVLWVCGLRVAERGRVIPSTQECLVLTARLAPPPDSRLFAGKGAGRSEC